MQFFILDPKDDTCDHPSYESFFLTIETISGVVFNKHEAC